MWMLELALAIFVLPFLFLPFVESAVFISSDRSMSDGKQRKIAIAQ
jgi:hypothetical protein